jgi:hypothetical protein
MTDSPSPNVGIVGFFIVLMGPVFGPFVVIVWAALAGAAWPLSKRKTDTKIEGALFLARTVGTATVITMPVAFLVEAHLGVPSVHAMSLAAFGVGLIGDNWSTVRQKIFERIFGPSKQEPNE